MSTFDTAVILAAGAGRRLKAVSDTPKPLLTLSGQAGDERLLDFHLRAAKEAGCKAVVIVGNKQVVRAPLRSILMFGPALEVRMVETVVDPTEYGTAQSLSRALEEARDLTDGKRIVVVNASVVYGDSVLERLAAHDANRSAVLVGGNAVTEVWGAGNGVIRVGRALSDTPVVEGLSLHGRATGLFSLAAEDVERARHTASWALEHSSGGKNSRADDIVQVLAERGRVDKVDIAEDDTVFAVDTPDDYARLITDIWPALLASRKAG